MMLDKRLNKIAELVSGTGIAADVGTDHAYLAAELINSGKCSKVIASDVKEGPLEAARNTVEKYGIQDKVELVLSDGLEKVDLNGVTDVVIAGMGGETITAIIGQCDAEMDNIRFILQPMTKVELLRKNLYELKFILPDLGSRDHRGIIGINRQSLSHLLKEILKLLFFIKKHLLHVLNLFLLVP